MPKTWSLCVRVCTAWPCSASRMQRDTGTTTRQWCRVCWLWPCRLPHKVSQWLEQIGEQQLCAELPAPAKNAAAAIQRQTRALRAPGWRQSSSAPRAVWVTGLCLPLGSDSGLHCVPFHLLSAESSHPLVSKVLLEEEVLTAMVPVISAATTHLSPE